MRGLAMTTIAIQEIDQASAEDVVAYAVERFHPRLTMACSFQKEESILLHMLLSVCPDPRVFTIDTGVLFRETLDTWKRFEDHFGVRIESFDARSRDEPWTSPAKISLAIGAGVPIGVFLCAYGASQSVSPVCAPEGFRLLDHPGQG